MKMAAIVFWLAAILIVAAPAQDSLNVRRIGSCSLPDEGLCSRHHWRPCLCRGL